MIEMELKPCPFCGRVVNENSFCSGDGFPKGCDCIWETTTAEESMRRWQSRPLEDALISEREALKAGIKKAIDYHDTLDNEGWIRHERRAFAEMARILIETLREQDAR